MVTLQQHWLEQGIEQGRDRKRVNLVHRLLLAYPEYAGDEAAVQKLSVNKLERLVDSVTQHADWKGIRKLLN